MGKNKTPQIKDIEKIKDELRIMNYIPTNIIEDNFVLVMDNTPFLKKFVFDAPMRSKEHRVMLVHSGWVKHTINFQQYTTHSSNILFVPANFIISVDGFSENFKASVISFNFKEMYSPNSIVGHDVIHLSVGFNEYKIIYGFYNMMHQVLSSPTNTKRDFEYLVLSFMMRIDELDSMSRGERPPVFLNRKQEVVASFIKLIADTDITTRDISTYAEKLNVTNNYLSVSVKEETQKTVMEWVNNKSLMLIKNLLFETTLSIEQISHQLGFSSASQLTRFFKRETGLTPAEYRKQKGKEE